MEGSSSNSSKPSASMDDIIETMEFLAIDGTPTRVQVGKSSLNQLGFDNHSVDMTLMLREEGWDSGMSAWMINTLCKDKPKDITEEEIDKFLAEKGLEPLEPSGSEKFSKKVIKKKSNAKKAKKESASAEPEPAVVEYDAADIVAQMQGLKVNEAPTSTCPDIFQRPGTRDRLGRIVEDLVQKNWLPDFIAGEIKMATNLDVSFEAIKAYMKFKGIGADLLGENAARDADDFRYPQDPQFSNDGVEYEVDAHGNVWQKIVEPDRPPATSYAKIPSPWPEAIDEDMEYSPWR